MIWRDARKSVARVSSLEDDQAVVSRRIVLAGIGFTGLFVAVPKLFISNAQGAEAKIDAPVAEPQAAKTEEPAEATQVAENAEPTDLSSRRYWRRRRYFWRRRRYWRRRYWGHRRRYWRQRYWRRRYWW